MNELKSYYQDIWSLRTDPFGSRNGSRELKPWRRRICRSRPGSFSSSRPTWRRLPPRSPRPSKPRPRRPRRGRPRRPKPRRPRGPRRPSGPRRPRPRFLTEVRVIELIIELIEELLSGYLDAKDRSIWIKDWIQGTEALEKKDLSKEAWQFLIQQTDLMKIAKKPKTRLAKAKRAKAKKAKKAKERKAKKAEAKKARRAEKAEAKKAEKEGKSKKDDNNKKEAMKEDNKSKKESKKETDEVNDWTTVKKSGRVSPKVKCLLYN